MRAGRSPYTACACLLKKSKRGHAAWRAYLRVAKQKEVATALTKANENRTKTERKLLQKSENRENHVLKQKKVFFFFFK